MELIECKFGKDVLSFNNEKEFNTAVFSNEYEVSVNELLFNILKLFIPKAESPLNNSYRIFKEYITNTSYKLSQSEKEAFIEQFIQDMDLVTYEICIHIFHKYFMDNINYRFSKHAFSRLISRFGRRDIDRLRSGIHSAVKIAKKEKSDFIILKNIVFVINLKGNDIITCYAPGVVSSFVTNRFNGGVLKSKNMTHNHESNNSNNLQLNSILNKIRAEAKGGN